MGSLGFYVFMSIVECMLLCVVVEKMSPSFWQSNKIKIILFGLTLWIVLPLIGLLICLLWISYWIKRM